ncbi:hypothetical protein [Cerasicoccus fimbriatus]|uniref:hypothetical protein n=1 Tax=Cerasicoccus fimbriatus TaxID=3014554 RepID=UPI0022B2F21C|nr:hypothetical protein [Cerasicoccus sp. TK19100]
MIGAPSPAVWWKGQCDLSDSEYRDRLGQCWTAIAPRVAGGHITVQELLDACEVFQVLPGVMFEAVEATHRAKQFLAATIDADQGETSGENSSLPEINGQASLFKNEAPTAATVRASSQR